MPECVILYKKKLIHFVNDANAFTKPVDIFYMTVLVLRYYNYDPIVPIHKDY